MVTRSDFVRLIVKNDLRSELCRLTFQNCNFCHFGVLPFPVVGEPVVGEEPMVVVGESFSSSRLVGSLARVVGVAVVQYFGHYNIILAKVLFWFDTY